MSKYCDDIIFKKAYDHAILENAKYKRRSVTYSGTERLDIKRMAHTDVLPKKRMSLDGITERSSRSSCVRASMVLYELTSFYD